MARTSKGVEDRREQILGAAIRVFAQKGFTRATNKDIAREAGITPGLIYHYFENKEAVLYAIIEGHSPLAMIRSLPSNILSQSPEVFLRFIGLQILTIVEGEEFVQLIRVFLPEVIHNPDLSPVGANLLQQVSLFLSRYLDEQVQNGTLCSTDTTLAAQVFIGSFMGFVMRRQLMHDASALRYSQEQIVAAVVSTTLAGLLPRA
jgi:Transcriptional regulator